MCRDSARLRPVGRRQAGELRGRLLRLQLLARRLASGGRQLYALLVVGFVLLATAAGPLLALLLVYVHAGIQGGTITCN